MSNLKEIRGRIGSVQSTLKITSAMRLISSAKMLSAQKAVSAALPYQKRLKELMAALCAVDSVRSVMGDYLEGRSRRQAIVLVTSNQNMCGGFNATLAKAFWTKYDALRAEGLQQEDIDCYAIGKFGLRSLKKAGLDPEDLCTMAQKPDYDASAALAQRLTDDFLAGCIGGVTIIYAHFASAGSQPVQTESFLPLAGASSSECSTRRQEEEETPDEDCIIEPDAPQMMALLLPKILKMGLHTILLDCAAAEHAARSLAMQIATDNASELLGELSLTYNKLRQQAITNEILDLAAGQNATN